MQHHILAESATQSNGSSVAGNLTPYHFGAERDRDSAAREPARPLAGCFGMRNVVYK